MEKEKGFRAWDWIGSIVAAVGAILFMLAPVINFETKYYVGEEKIKNYFTVTLGGMFDSSVTRPWIMTVILVLIGLSVLFIALSGILKIKGKNAKLASNFAAASAFGFAIALCFIFASKEIFTYYADGLIENFNGASLGWGSAASMVLIAIAMMLSLTSSSYGETDSVRAIAEDGIFIAAAFVLSYIKIPMQTNGGSVNFQMLPLMLIALRRGPLHGFVASGLVYGLLTCLTDGYGFATYPFDYLIGFGSAGVIGFFSPLILGEKQENYNWKGVLWIVVGGVASTAVRFIGSTASSMIIYDYPFDAACIYNAIYIPVSGAISIAVLVALYGPLLRINRMFPANKKRLGSTAAQEE